MHGSKRIAGRSIFKFGNSCGGNSRDTRGMLHSARSAYSNIPNLQMQSLSDPCQAIAAPKGNTLAGQCPFSDSVKRSSGGRGLWLHALTAANMLTTFAPRDTAVCPSSSGPCSPTTTRLPITGPTHHHHTNTWLQVLSHGSSIHISPNSISIQ